MSKASREFFEMVKDERSGGEILPPGLRDGKFFSDIGAELKHQLSAGAHELAAALFNGSAFVMYPRHEGQDSVEQPMHGLVNEPQKEVDLGMER
jgi:hypothetical protein